MDPKTCILIPCYNSDETIAETLHSIQNARALDEISGIFLADDASTDRTVEVAQEAWKEKRIPLTVLPSEQNAGERTNVNRAVTEIERQGFEWFLIIHADDLARENWIELMRERIRNTGERTGSLCSSWENLTPSGVIEPGEDIPGEEVHLKKGINDTVVETLRRGCWWHISGCAIRIAAFRDVGEFHPEMPQLGDWDWLMRLLEGEWDVEYIPRTLITYRLHGASVSSTSFRINRDLRETLMIGKRHRKAMQPPVWNWFHRRLLAASLRRILSALTRFQINRAVTAASLPWQTIRSWSSR